MKFRGEEMSQSDYLQPGIHECEIFLGNEERTIISKKDGQSYQVISIGFRGASGAAVFEDYFLNSKSLWVLKKVYDAAGITKEDVDIKDLIGEFVTVNVKHETYNKKDGSQGTKSVVESISPVSKGNAEDAPDGSFPESKGKSDPF